MMREIRFTNKFKKDRKREKRTDPKIDDVLIPVIELLAADADLPERLFDHALNGNWKSYRDCHIKPDLLLLYMKTKGEISLVRLGSHSELFG